MNDSGSVSCRGINFGVQVLFLLAGWSGPVMGGTLDTNSLPDPSSSLRPPRGEIVPGFWEQYGGWVVLGGILLLLSLVLVAWLLTRPKQPAPVPWSVQARQQLERLRDKPEDGLLLSRVSQILRHQMAAAFGLSLDEATTPEFCRALAASNQVGPELASEIVEFLQQCDLRKFSPQPPTTVYGVVSRALKIVEDAEHRLAELNRSAATGEKGHATAAANGAGQQRMASGA